MTVPTHTHMPVPPAECRHCTVPTNGTDVCNFCCNYTAPETVTQRLDVAVNKVDLLRHDINEELQNLPAAAPLFAVVDLVAALARLRQAAVLLDRATDQLEATEAQR